jgi:hypothetical protein
MVLFFWEGGGKGEGELGKGELGKGEMGNGERGKGKGARESVVLFVHRSIASTCHSSFRESGNPGIRERKRACVIKGDIETRNCFEVCFPKKGKLKPQKARCLTESGVAPNGFHRMKSIPGKETNLER